MKPGVQSSEFILVVVLVVLNVVGAVSGYIQEPEKVVVVNAAIAGAYALLRTFAKWQGLKIPSDLDKPQDK